MLFNIASRQAAREVESSFDNGALKENARSRSLCSLRCPTENCILSPCNGDHVFHDPKTGEPWNYYTITDVRSFWELTLKQLGIRYRRPYTMRHTYATIGLMSGAKPAFLASQLGHSLRVFFDIYAKWISSRDDRAEIAKLNAAIEQKTHNEPKAIHKDEKG